jgi:hypothetical protein
MAAPQASPAPKATEIANRITPIGPDRCARFQNPGAIFAAPAAQQRPDDRKKKLDAWSATGLGERFQ